MNRVGFFNETKQRVYNLNKLKRLIEYAIRKEELKNVEFSITFIDSEKMRYLNKTYRQIDKDTDVLAFAFEDYKDINYHNYRLLGDIYISLDVAKKQAKEEQHSLLEELSFIMIHGFLHLLGYDHHESNDEILMKLKEEEILHGFSKKKQKQK
jgi:probable rRNA maturation factor